VIMAVYRPFPADLQSEIILMSKSFPRKHLYNPGGKPDK
jgi:hypothetical protein